MSVQKPWIENKSKIPLFLTITSFWPWLVTFYKSSHGREYKYSVIVLLWMCMLQLCCIRYWACTVRCCWASRVLSCGLTSLDLSSALTLPGQLVTYANCVFRYYCMIFSVVTSELNCFHCFRTGQWGNHPAFKDLTPMLCKGFLWDCRSTSLISGIHDGQLNKSQQRVSLKWHQSELNKVLTIL